MKIYSLNIKNLIYKSITLLLCTIFIMGLLSISTHALYDQMRVLGEEEGQEYTYPESFISAITIELSTGTVISEKDAKKVIIAPAEITMMLNALVFAGSFETVDYDTDLTVGEVASINYTDVGSVGIRTNNVVTNRDLLSLMFLYRGQDAASILANQITTSEVEYVQKMNDKVQTILKNKLALYNSYFTNVNGLEDVEQVTTPEEIVYFVSALSEYEEIWNIFNLSEYEVSESAKSRLNAAYSSVLPQSEETIKSIVWGSTSEYDIGVYVDERDFTTLSVVVFEKGTDGTETMQTVFESHNEMYDRYVFKNPAFIGQTLCDEYIFPLGEKKVKGYVKEEDFANYIFEKEFFNLISTDAAALKENFSLVYDQYTIFPESIGKDAIIYSSSLEYRDEHMGVIPIYSTDIVVETENPNEDVSFFEYLWNEQRTFVIIAIVVLAVILIGIILLILNLILRNGKKNKEKIAIITEEKDNENITVVTEEKNNSSSELAEEISPDMKKAKKRIAKEKAKEKTQKEQQSGEPDQKK